MFVPKTMKLNEFKDVRIQSNKALISMRPASLPSAGVYSCSDEDDSSEPMLLSRRKVDAIYNGARRLDAEQRAAKRHSVQSTAATTTSSPTEHAESTETSGS
ncbi:MAG: hypothetical protein [Microviridae sp.]|nr:MAG: hypothetical protein [Microviridae sp.]